MKLWLARGSAVLCLTACASAPGAASPTSAPPSAQVASGNAATCSAQSALPVAARGPVASLPIDVLLGGLANPDDLLVNDDRVYIGELGAGRIRVLSSGIDAATLPAPAPAVEGMAMINGALYAAEQVADRVTTLTAAGQPTLLQLRPVAGVDGIDGIGATSAALLVPDSARGTVNVVAPDGRITRSVGGFARPTDALSLPDGSLLVADENAGQVVAVAPDGARTVVATALPSVDDVVVDGAGAEFAITETASGRLVRLVGGHAVDVASDLAQPQGLAVDGAGNLLITESGVGRTEVVVRTFRALPFPAPQPRNVALCLDLHRAPGFTAAVQLDPAPGVSILAQPERGSVARVALRGCASPCRLVARSGVLESTIWLATSG